jgi:hypothetical protein
MIDLDKLEMINYPPFVDPAGSKRLIDLVHVFREGRTPPNLHEFAEDLEWLTNSFSLGGHLKTGQWWTGQNRPTGLVRD